jgi:uncharacterized membrane protein YtjA (UPF0391 family)
MISKRNLIFAVVLTSLLLTAARLGADCSWAPLAAFAAIILFPGSVLDILWSRNPHAGFGGIKGAVVTTAGSLMFWFLVLVIVIAIVARAIRERQ